MPQLQKLSNAQLENLKQANQKIIAKGFLYLKVELEAHLYRNSNHVGECERKVTPCKDCKGEGEKITYEKNTKNVLFVMCQTCEGVGSVGCQCEKLNLKTVTDSMAASWFRANIPKRIQEKLTFWKFYNDGSVDSELTFTLPTEFSHFAYEMIGVWNDFIEYVGRGKKTRNAGMHIAILNDPRGRYGVYEAQNHLDSRSLANFNAQIKKLLPALFFLASPDYKSRPLGFRGIDSAWSNQKYRAVNSSSRVLEYRVFETCYDNPLAMLDNIAVIAETLKFYSRKKVLPSKMMKTKTSFVVLKGDVLSRFYSTPSSLRALDAGLAWIKPPYKTIDQLKAERRFKVNEKKLIKKAKIVDFKAVSLQKSYNEQVKRQREEFVKQRALFVGRCDAVQLRTIKKESVSRFKLITKREALKAASRSLYEYEGSI